MSSNPFYQATGNPAQGAEGLSALVRGEFALIQTAFDLMPRISTTGLSQTVFDQQGSYAFILPGASGTLALVADVAAEASRAENAEAANAAAISAEMTARGTAISAETTARGVAVGVETARAEAAEALLAPLASPTLTGVPSAPTAAPGTSTTQLATTAFATAAAAALVSGVASVAGRSGVVTLSVTDISGAAPLASPTLTGDPLAPTASAGTNTTQIATTAFTTAAVAVETARAEAAETAIPTLGRLLAVQVFAVSGTYTPTSGMRFVRARMQGGGGAGAGATVPSGGTVTVGTSGAAGSYAEALILATAIGSSQTVTIGAAGTAASGANGGAGGTTSLGSLMTTPGGPGGIMSASVSSPIVAANGSASAAPSFGSGTTPVVAVYGGSENLTVGMTAGNGAGAAGGRSQFGIGGLPAGINTPGSSAPNPGAGGGGVYAGSGVGASIAGGNGHAGILIIEEYS